MPFKSRADVLAELNQVRSPSFELESMAVVLDYKQKSRQAKHIPFNCFLLSADEHKSEPADLVKFLDENKHHFCEPVRFQVIYRGMYKKFWHYSAMDIQVDKAGVKVYLLDAGSPYNILNIMADIYSVAPSAQLYLTAGPIQLDKHECATYAWDHVCRLSKITNLHEVLPEIEYKGKIDQYDNFKHYMEAMLDTDPRLKNFDKSRIMPAICQVKHIPIEYFPALFTPLLRNKEDIFKLPKWFGATPAYKANNREPLVNYLIPRQKIKWSIDDMGSVDVKNTAIFTKREHIKTKAAKHLEVMSEVQYDALVQARAGQVYSYLKLFMNIASPSASSKNLFARPS